MDLDFTALASRVAARAEILGCVILSRDGLVLGAFPPNGEQDITPGLMRFAALGEPERGFVQFSDELWAYLRQGSERALDKAYEEKLGYAPIPDVDFANDVQAGIESRRDSFEPPEWD